MAVLKPGEVAEKLKSLSGNMAAVGRALGVSRQAVCQFCGRRPKLLAVARDCKESMLDDVEGALHRAALAGEAWAVCFFLKTQGRSRGYVERQEVTGSDGGPVKFSLEDLAAADRELREWEREHGTGEPDRNGDGRRPAAP